MNHFSKFKINTLSFSLSILSSISLLSGCNFKAADSKDAEGLTDLPVKENLVLHLEADRGVAVADNKVTGWIDNSLLGNNLTTSVGDPTLVVQSSNGQPAIHFDGRADRLERTDDLNGLPAENSDRTVFLAVKYSSNGFGGFAYGRPTSNNTFGLVVDNSGDLAIQAWGQDNDRRTKVMGNGSGWLTQSAKLEQGILTYYKSGVKLNNFAHQYNTIPEQLVVGAEIDNSSQVDMEVSAIVVFQRALSEPEREKVEAYLQNKYLSDTENET